MEDPFHISKACIEPTTSKGKITSVYVESNDEEFLVCNLSDKILNETLDLNFNMGDKIVFKTSVIDLIQFHFLNLSCCEIFRKIENYKIFSLFLIDRTFWRDYFIVSVCINLINMSFVSNANFFYTFSKLFK